MFSFRKKKAPSGRYHGRLAFDPETDFHLAEDGARVVTKDGGKTWHYAGAEDKSHFERYHERFVEVDSTANAADPEPHHYGVLATDPHVNGLIFDPDKDAATVTSHTEAYK